MAKPRVYRVQIAQNKAGAWFYRLRAPNGNIMQSGESYASPGNAKRAASRFGKLLAVPHIIETV